MLKPSLRFLLFDNSVISCLEQDNIAFFQEKLSYFVNAKNEVLTLSNDEKGSISNPLFSTKYSFSLNGLSYFVEDFESFDLCVLEVEFANALQITTYQMPDFLHSFCKKNITNDDNYSLVSLALFGKSDFEIDENILKRAGLFGEFGLCVTPVILASFGAQVLLFGLFKKLEKALVSFLSKKTQKNLGFLLDILEHNLAIISSFNAFFDEQIISKIFSPLKDLASKLNDLKAQNYLCEYVKRQNISTKNNFSRARNESEDELVLEAGRLEPLLKDWALILGEPSGFYSSQSGLKNLKSAAIEPINLAILAFISANDGERQSATKDLYFVLSSFGGLYQEKLSSKIVKKLAKILEIYEHANKCELLINKLNVEQMRVLVEELRKSQQKSLKKIAKKSKKIAIKASKFEKIIKLYERE